MSHTDKTTPYSVRLARREADEIHRSLSYTWRPRAIGRIARAECRGERARVRVLLASRIEDMTPYRPRHNASWIYW